MRKYFCILLSTMLVLLSLNACGKASETKNSNNNNDTSSSTSSVSDAAQGAADSSLSSDAAAMANSSMQQSQDNNAALAADTVNNSTAGTAGSNASATKNNDGNTTATVDVKGASAAVSSASGSSSSKAATSSAVSSKPSSSAASSSKPASGGSTSSSKNSSAGNMGSFTMTDLNGNTANQSIFNNYTLTMVNVWATYCNPCIKEIPGISDVYNQVKSKGVNIIGVVSDGAGKLDTVKELVNKTGASYKMYIPSSSMLQNSFMSNLSFVPTTFFVDRNGNRVGSPMSGSKTADQWLSTINDMLSRVS